MNNKIIIIDNVEYNIDLYESTENLIKLERFKNLSMLNWEKLLQDKNGYYQSTDLLKILNSKVMNFENEIKHFYFKDNLYWLNKDTRNNINNLLKTNLSDFLLVLPDKIVILSKEEAQKFMGDLEIFSYKCFVTTQNHLLSIKHLKSVEDMTNYDYTKGYPDRIILNGIELTNN